MKEQLIELLKSPDNIELAFILGEGQNINMGELVNEVYPIDFLKEHEYLKETTLLEQVKESLQLDNIYIHSTIYPKEIFNLKCYKYFYNEYRQLHREDGPAVIMRNDAKFWYLNGQRHREDGPAIEYSDGSKHWYLNDKIHREDGPAKEHSNGDKHWYLNGKKHREDGPAVILRDGSKKYFINGKELSEKEFNKLKVGNVK